MTEAAAGANGAAPAVETVPLEKYQRVDAEARDLKIRLEQYKDIDPVAVKAMKEDYELMRKQQTGGDPKKIDELVAAKETEIRSSVQKALDGLKQENETYKGKLKELQVTDTVFSKAADKFIPQAHDDLKDYIRRYGDIGDDGAIIFKDEKGAPRYAPGSTTKLMGIDDFAKWLSDVKPHWAAPEGKGGAKAPGVKSNGVTSNGASKTWAELSLLPDKGKAYMHELAKTDPKAFNELLAQAKF